MTIPQGNPWLSLRANQPYIADVDRPILDNEHQERYRLHCEVLPHAWVGNPLTARVLLLQLNPGWATADKTDEERYEAYARLERRSLNLDPGAEFFLLDPALRDTSGAAWWRQRLRRLIDACGEEVVRAGLSSVEYFPYHSEKYAWPPVLPSQNFGFELVRRAVQNGSFVLVMRQWELWRAAVPELIGLGDDRLRRNPNPRQAAISSGNLGTEVFGMVVAALTDR